MIVDRVATADLTEALDSSFLAAVDPGVRSRLVADGRVLTIPAAYMLVDGYREFGGIVMSGLLRVFAQASDGRPSITYRNAARGDAVGLGALLGVQDEIWVETITPATVLSLRLASVRFYCGTDASLALALAGEAMRRLQSTTRELRLWARGTVRDRTIRCLLDMAQGADGGVPTCVRVSHEQLAERVGSTREVVTRALGHLERIGLVRLGRGQVKIPDIVLLSREIHAISETR